MLRTKRNLLSFGVVAALALIAGVRIEASSKSTASNTSSPGNASGAGNTSSVGNTSSQGNGHSYKGWLGVRLQRVGVGRRGCGFGRGHLPGLGQQCERVGGLEGHPVQLIVKDDQTNPGDSITDAHTLVSDHVVAIVDDSALDGTWASYIEGTKIPVVGGETTEPTQWTNPDFYDEGQTNNTLAWAIASMVKDAGLKSFSNFYCVEAPVCFQTTASVGKVADSLG